MSQSLTIARQTLLDLPGLSDNQLEKVMDRLLSRQVDAADIYFQYGRLESWVLEDGIIKEGSHSIEQGAGLRAISGDKTGSPIPTVSNYHACSKRPAPRGQSHRRGNTVAKPSRHRPRCPPYTPRSTRWKRSVRRRNST